MLQGYLDNHEGPGRAHAAATKARAAQNWMEMGQTPEARLLQFDRWVIGQLEVRLVWPDDPARKAKLLGQCKAELEKLVLELWRRGWMLDGARLASHITRVLDSIGGRQRAGAVKDFWPYFRHAVTTHVGANAEEIQAEARKTPTVGSILGTLGVSRRVSGAAGTTIPELVAQRRDETLKEKLAKARKSDAPGVNDGQLGLFGGPRCRPADAPRKVR